MICLSTDHYGIQQIEMIASEFNQDPDNEPAI